MFIGFLYELVADVMQNRKFWAELLETLLGLRFDFKPDSWSITLHRLVD